MPSASRRLDGAVAGGRGQQADTTGTGPKTSSILEGCQLLQPLQRAGALLFIPVVSLGAAHGSNSLNHRLRLFHASGKEDDPSI
jgi:hypothetical protein